MYKILFSILLFSGYMWADTIVPSTGSDLKMTIYNDNRAFINDIREVTVDKGKQKLIYEGVPTSVVSQSVVPSFVGMKTNLYSQNYMYDLISLDSMLKNSIDKEVMFTMNGEKSHLSKGLLLSASPVMIQENDTKHIYTLESPTQVIFSKIPETMITKPSLVWDMETERAGTLGVDLKYLATGISWKSDYVLNLKKDVLDLTGWITVKNNSGVAYENAQITCLAGDVNRVKEPIHRKNRMYKADMVMAMPEVATESFSGYHIYKIPFRETIVNKQQKQISFIDKKEIAYRHYGTHTNNYFEQYYEQKLVFTNTVEFDNTKVNNLGLALPSGIVRMYQKDSSGETHFIGEERVHNIPEDENVTLRVGTLFDAVGKKSISKYVARKDYRNVETKYSIRNQGTEPLVLKIKEKIPTYGNHITVKTSCTDKCSVKKESAFVREFTITLDGKEKYMFTTEFEVSY
ncbi:MAG: Unknown protein [uncultured Sulfurovum sp.]|uniref:DUF4139 domain-containing protein n=1 Tax=uncultured Sulfurovum sp. TaxID=269237 RepID=A0A6S6RY80_9BACT|nr:MAG: Unknown protein [uncultured Sulfurovum sp.]